MVDNSLQYPDTITLTWYSEPEQIEGTGRRSKGALQTFTSECRCKPNSSSGKIQGADGIMIDYRYNIFMPKTDVIIPDFTAEFTLTQEDGKVLTGNVKTSKNNLFNSQLWL